MTHLRVQRQYPSRARGSTRARLRARPGVSGSSSILLAGMTAAFMQRPTPMSLLQVLIRAVSHGYGLNTIEFYSGDISANFATSQPPPQANGGAQDNGSMSVTFFRHTDWPRAVADGQRRRWIYGRIDPVGNRFWQGNNSGHLSICVSNWHRFGATWTDTGSPWSNPARPISIIRSPLRDLQRYPG